MEKAYKADSPFTSFGFNIKSKYPANVFTDSIYNTVTGESMMLLLPLGLLALVIAALVILLIYWFIKLIFNINKSIIFEWKNVKLLRKIGILLIGFYVCGIIFAFLFGNYASSLVSIPGYFLDNSKFFSYGSLIQGIIALIVAEIFAIGLKLKEEQDLTV